jgi:hypothetical protein
MILYYAIGGGLGHLTRARAVMHTLGLGDDVAIMTASRFARDRRVLGPATPVEVRPELATDRPAYLRWLRATIDRVEPEAIYIDAFPAGIVGELCGFALPSGVPVVHIARLLRWDRYGAALTSALPRFDRVHRVEPLTDEHALALSGCAADIAPLALDDPPRAMEPAIESRVRAIAAAGSPLWIVLHSGPEAEVEELLRFADRMARDEAIEPQVIVASQTVPASLPERAIHLDIYPATPLLPHAARIITGCGFNAMRQAAPYRERHRFMPFARHYDDQELRARRHSPPSLPG